MSTGLLDGDMFAYRSAASAENEPLDIAIMRLDLMVRESLEHVNDYFIAIGGTDNFRYKINPDYKGNRKDTPKPIHLAACKEFLLKEYNAIICNGYEADDYLGFSQTDNTIIFTNDKDLLQVPGQHFNPIKGEYREVSELDGLKSVYKQALIGDSSDNIKGVEGLGKVKSSKLLDHLNSEEELYNIVLNLYDTEERFFLNMNCLWVMRIEGEKYTDRDWIKNSV